MNMKCAIESFWNNHTHWYSRINNGMSHSQVNQQFYNLTTKNMSEIKPEYWANKNTIRKPLFHSFIINIYNKHEAETGERNIALTLRKLLSLCQQIASTFSGIKRNRTLQLVKNSLISGFVTVALHRRPKSPRFRKFTPFLTPPAEETLPPPKKTAALIYCRLRNQYQTQTNKQSGKDDDIEADTYVLRTASAQKSCQVLTPR